MRKINYTLGVDSVSPSKVQNAGFQSEYNATKVIFTFSEQLQELLSNLQGTPTWWVEAIDAQGGMSIHPLEVDGNKGELVIPTAVTMPGTVLILQPAVSMQDENSEMLNKLYFPSVKIKFGPSVSGMVADTEQYDRYSRNLVGAMQIALQSAENACLSAEQSSKSAEEAELCAQRAEATLSSWALLKEETVAEPISSYYEKVEELGDTCKGVRVKLFLPANTAMVNNRTTLQFSLNSDRHVTVRGEGMTVKNSVTLCCFDILPRAGVWNCEVSPYVKSMGTVTGDITYAKGDKVRYIKLIATEANPIPAQSKIEIWGLQ